MGRNASKNYTKTYELMEHKRIKEEKKIELLKGTYYFLEQPHGVFFILLHNVLSFADILYHHPSFSEVLDSADVDGVVLEVAVLQLRWEQLVEGQPQILAFLALVDAIA